MRAEQLMHAGEQAPIVRDRDADARRHLRDVRKGLGMSCVVDDAGALVGIITDGDLRRHMVARPDAARARRPAT